MLSAKVDAIRLREIREERELTGSQVAALLSKELGRPVHETTVYKIEQGTRQPGARFFGAMCRVLRAERAELLIPNDAKADA